MTKWSKINMDEWSDGQREIYSLYLNKNNGFHTRKIDFAFEQAETELNSSIRNREMIQEKSNNLIKLSFSFLTIFSGFFYFILTGERLEVLELEQLREFIIVMFFLVSAIVVLAVLMLLSVSFVQGYYYPGEIPIHILNEKDEELSAYQLKVWEIIDYEDRINYNRNAILSNAVRLKWSYYLVYSCIALVISSPSLAFLYTIN